MERAATNDRRSTAWMLVGSAALALLAVPVTARAQEAGTTIVVSDDIVQRPDCRSAAVWSAADILTVAWEPGPLGPPGIHVRRFGGAGTPLGASFRVDTSTFIQRAPSIAAVPAGDFMVVWVAQVGGALGDGAEIYGRRFSAAGSPLGDTFRVNTTTASIQTEPAVAVEASGRAVVAWTTQRLNANGLDVVAQRYDAAGVALGGEFQVNTTHADFQHHPAVAFLSDGGFVVAWQSRGQDGSGYGLYARTYDALGLPRGGEFRVNSGTRGDHVYPAVGAAGSGGFAVSYTSIGGADGPDAVVYVRVYDGAGQAQAERRVASGDVRLAPRYGSSVLSAREGGFQVVWNTGAFPFLSAFDAQGAPLAPPAPLYAARERIGVVDTPALASAGDGRVLLVGCPRDTPITLYGQRFGPLWPAALGLGPLPGDDVLEPGETVVFAPAWQNRGTAAASVTGSISSFSGPGSPSSYLLVDAQAAYGVAAPGASASCASAGDCYLIHVANVARPAPHWDARVRETLQVAPGEPQEKLWSVHVGATFADVPPSHPDYRAVEALVHHNVIPVGSPAVLAPKTEASRAETAAALVRARVAPACQRTFGASAACYAPPRPPRGLFDDVPETSPFAPWIEDAADRGIVGPCGPDRFCPAGTVRRDEMAVFVLRALEGPSYQPPACTVPPFADVPCSHPRADWINELAARGLAPGCGGGNYCPEGLVTRGGLAAFVARGFRLELYGPEAGS